MNDAMEFVSYVNIQFGALNKIWAAFLNVHLAAQACKLCIPHNFGVLTVGCSDSSIYAYTYLLRKQGKTAPYRLTKS